MRTELQYNLQLARALTTLLRITLEEAMDAANDAAQTAAADASEALESVSYEIEANASAANDIESWLDDLHSSLVGEGSIKLTFEPNVKP